MYGGFFIICAFDWTVNDHTDSWSRVASCIFLSNQLRWINVSVSISFSQSCLPPLLFLHTSIQSPTLYRCNLCEYTHLPTHTVSGGFATEKKNSLITGNFTKHFLRIHLKFIRWKELYQVIFFLSELSLNELVYSWIARIECWFGYLKWECWDDLLIRVDSLYPHHEYARR